MRYCKICDHNFPEQKVFDNVCPSCGNQIDVKNKDLFHQFFNKIKQTLLMIFYLFGIEAIFLVVIYYLYFSHANVFLTIGVCLLGLGYGVIKWSAIHED